jgi:hypothetical protein
MTARRRLSIVLQFGKSIQRGSGLTDRCGSRRIPRATLTLVSRYVSTTTSFRQPQPIMATFIFSLGGVFSVWPSTCLGMIVNAVPATATLRNVLRPILARVPLRTDLAWLFMILISPCYRVLLFLKSTSYSRLPLNVPVPYLPFSPNSISPFIELPRSEPL